MSTDVGTGVVSHQADQTSTNLLPFHRFMRLVQPSVGSPLTISKWFWTQFEYLVLFFQIEDRPMKGTSTHSFMHVPDLQESDREGGGGKGRR